MINCIKRTIKFDRSNKNAVLFKTGNRLDHMIAIPPSKNKCTLIPLQELDDYNIYDFEGLIIVQSRTNKMIIRNGRILDEIEL